uniref:CCHC-type domain-containing protein n=1 Tax=Quercus lobata TaxID=97700 RepID=A0A7N2KN43_QUELO
MEERSPSLSREEQEELIRSNKKVKDVNHAGYHEGRDSFPSSPSHGYSPWNRATSFKEKLIGEILGAFTQAFNFGELMEDDVESDDEVEDLRQGLVAVKFSKSFKQQIRKPWAKALIVKGPWFIGEHFLSIRPWELDFRPETASISSIAIWIRLNNLPIEYYNVEALHHIGKLIGNVLRVDTHTAFETRGRFARLCVQIDVNKPLVTAILIGKFEQPICYEGIQKLCFGCGRMGHKQEICSYIVWHDLPRQTAENIVEGKLAKRSCEECVTDKDKAGEGTTENVPSSGHEDAMDRGYGP